MKLSSCILLIVVFGLLAIGSILSGCYSRNVHRVVVTFPAQWSDGEYRNCSVTTMDVVVGRSDLDCDKGSPETPRSRMFALDVEFSGQFYEAGAAVGHPEWYFWTCQKGPVIVCRR
jgi:hypothetical protein